MGTVGPPMIILNASHSLAFAQFKFVSHPSFVDSLIDHANFGIDSTLSNAYDLKKFCSLHHNTFLDQMVFIFFIFYFCYEM